MNTGGNNDGDGDDDGDGDGGDGNHGGGTGTGTRGFAVLPPQEVSRDMVSLCLTLKRHCSGSGNNSGGAVVLARVVSWACASRSLVAWEHTTGGASHASTSSSSSSSCLEREGMRFNKAVHQHCQRRQHESLCKEVLSALKKDAAAAHDRWIISPRVTAAASLSDSSSTPTDITLASFRALLASEGMSSTLDVSFLNRGQVEVMLSQSLTLEVALVSQWTTSPSSSESESDAAQNGDGDYCVKGMDAVRDALRSASSACIGEYTGHLRQRVSRRVAARRLEQQQEDGEGKTTTTTTTTAAAAGDDNGGDDDGDGDDIDVADGGGGQSSPAGLLRNLCEAVKTGLASA
jgi:hypothetical protein